MLGITSSILTFGTFVSQHENALHALSSALLEHETLSAEEIKRILLSYRNQQVDLEEEEDFMSD